MSEPTIIYMDHAATTPTDPRVLEAMSPYFCERFANPATLYTSGRENDRVIESVRSSIAATINASPEEIYFTSGGTESDNWAVKGAAWANEAVGRHIVTSAIEHHAVLESCEYLEKRGWDLTVLPVSPTGAVDVEDVGKALRKDTVLISIMHANNEGGTIEPIAEIARRAQATGTPFETEPAQPGGEMRGIVRVKARGWKDPGLLKTHNMTWDQVPEAYQAYADHADNSIKIAVSVPD